ncbi:MAG: glycosyltransferase [Lachnospiraceae bacterium]|nr:glycosyltransferase [Lachnospiraceae bacterium]
MLVFVKGYVQTLDYIIECMQELEGYEKLVLDIRSNTFWHDIEVAAAGFNQDTIVVLLNNVGYSVEYHDGKNLWEEKGVKLYNYMVDHPILYTKYLAKPLSNMTVLMMDRNHKRFVDKFFPQVMATHFFPHGGMASNIQIPYAQREIDVLYIGSCQRDLGNDYSAIEFFPDKGVDLYTYAFNKFMTDETTLDVTDILQMYLDEKQISPITEEFVEMVKNLYQEVQARVRRLFKINIIRALAANNIRVVIYGEEWEEVEEEFPGILDIRARVTKRECIDLVANSKIVMNFMTWLKDGSHERTYYAMMNKAVCVTDKSKFMEERYTHGEDIIFFDYHYPQGLADDIKHLLHNDSIAERIAENGYQKAKNSAWKDRLLNILNEDFSDYM